MRRLLVICALGALLAGCGGETSNSPEETHTAWVAALRANDREAAQALLAPDAEVSVDRALAQAQYLVGHGAEGTGVLVAVDVEPLRAQGAGQVGRSVWRLERLNSCFLTTLARTEAGWRVTGWAERQTDCPPAANGGG